MSHDTSRHSIRGDVICSECGRQLRGAQDLRGRWTVRRHKRPDGRGCLGYLFTGHRALESPTGFVLRFVAVAGPLPADPRLRRLVESHVGRYLRVWDRTAREPRAQIVTTDDKADALAFPSPAEAFRYWQTPVGVRRHDGRPDRPLTYFTVEVVPT